jgi:hypothetical protein
MAWTVVGLHQGVSNACPRVELEAGEQSLKRRIQASLAAIPRKADETSKRFAGSQVVKQPPLSWWKESGQVVEGEADSHRQARLERPGKRTPVENRLELHSERRQPTPEGHARCRFTVSHARPGGASALPPFCLKGLADLLALAPPQGPGDPALAHVVLRGQGFNRVPVLPIVRIAARRSQPRHRLADGMRRPPRWKESLTVISGPTSATSSPTWRWLLSLGTDPNLSHQSTRAVRGCGPKDFPLTAGFLAV